MPHPAAPSERAERLKEAGGSGGISTGEADLPSQELEKTTTEPNNAALKTQNSPIGQVDLPSLEPNNATLNPEITATEEANLTSGKESNPKALSQPQSRSGGHLGAVTSPVTSAAALTPAQTEKQRQQQRREEAQLAKMTWWLALGDPILVKEAEDWFAARSERARSQLGVEETDPGG